MMHKRVFCLFTAVTKSLFMSQNCYFYVVVVFLNTVFKRSPLQPNPLLQSPCNHFCVCSTIHTLDCSHGNLLNAQVKPTLGHAHAHGSDNDRQSRGRLAVTLERGSMFPTPPPPPPWTDFFIHFKLKVSNWDRQLAAA